MPSLGQQVGERAAVGMDLDVCSRLGPGGSLVLESEDRCAIYLGDELVGRLLDREVLLVRVEAAPQVDLQSGEVLPLDREWYVGDDLGSVVGIREGDVDVSANTALARCLISSAKRVNCSRKPASPAGGSAIVEQEGDAAQLVPGIPLVADERIGCGPLGELVKRHVVPCEDLCTSSLELLTIRLHDSNHRCHPPPRVAVVVELRS